MSDISEEFWNSCCLYFKYEILILAIAQYIADTNANNPYFLIEYNNLLSEFIVRIDLL